MILLQGLPHASPVANASVYAAARPSSKSVAGRPVPRGDPRSHLRGPCLPSCTVSILLLHQTAVRAGADPEVRPVGGRRVAPLRLVELVWLAMMLVPAGCLETQVSCETSNLSFVFFKKIGGGGVLSPVPPPPCPLGGKPLVWERFQTRRRACVL